MKRICRKVRLTLVVLLVLLPFQCFGEAFLALLAFKTVNTTSDPNRLTVSEIDFLA